jgi:hypothetical protein
MSKILINNNLFVVTGLRLIGYSNKDVYMSNLIEIFKKNKNYQLWIEFLLLLGGYFVER